MCARNAERLKTQDLFHMIEVRIISYRKQDYADLNKWRKTLTNYNREYYRKTAKYPARTWTDEEIELIMKREMSDRELSEMLGRSMKSIILKRHRIKKSMEQERIKT